MKAMVCEMCGSHDLVKQDGMYVCQSCGTKYSVEEAKKLLGTVKVDKTEETEKLLVLARRAREYKNHENAEKYYGMVLLDDPNNWEAAFFQVYHQSMQCSITKNPRAAYAIVNNIDSTMRIISEITDETEKNNAIDTVIMYSRHIALLLLNSAWSLEVDGAFGESECRLAAAKSIYDMLENTLKKYFCDDTDHLLKVLKEKDSIHKSPSVQSGGCYVATAVYGSYDCPHVWTLRRFRDYSLAKTWYGRAFIRTYYAISPTLVKWFGNTKWFKDMWKPTLDRMVKRLNSKGIKNTPYNDRNW